jgi:flagellar hook-associated protein 2
VDVAGTINGVAASGSGRSLTGATGTAVEGLKLEVVGGVTGSRGSVNYSQGYAYLLDKLASQMLGANGTVASRTDGLNKSIEDIADRREILNRRLEETERRLRAQFTALDGLLAKLRASSDSLSRMLATLPGAGGTQGSR